VSSSASFVKFSRLLIGSTPAADAARLIDWERFSLRLEDSIGPFNQTFDLIHNKSIMSLKNKKP
jgi:hypothetical protein